MSDEIKSEVEKLRKQILEADKAYYVDSNPVMADQDYDSLYDRLKELEEKYPELYDPNSPTSRVGSDIDNNLPEKEHTVPILSLDKCYSFDDLETWINRLKEKLSNNVELIIEPKIDGAGVVLYYENGKLDRALTRGNGFLGNDITENIKTIGSVPLVLDKNITVAARGEVFINKKDFNEFNEKHAEGKYSNPRNLASGSMRRQKSRETALFPLNIFVYEGFYEEDHYKNHLDILIHLKNLGFPLNDNLGFFSDNIDKNMRIPFKKAAGGKLSDIKEYIQNINKIRENIDYEIDGLVIKLNDLEDREKLGFTQHHPRWAIAYKFDAPMAETKVVSIEVQIGRGGRVTPVANLESVELSGSIISRATLHNNDYINTLGVNAGDTVTISKRGDVIPAVEEVTDKGKNINAYRMPEECPVCKTKLIEGGAHLFCPNSECDGRLLGTLQYFVSRGQMDIESLGDKTIEFLFGKGFIRYIPDIYEFDYKKLLDFEGFKDKKVNNIIQSVEKSKEKDFKTVLSSLGLKDIGNKIAEILVEKFTDIDELLGKVENKNIEEFVEIDGIGDSIANSIINSFSDDKVLRIIEHLKNAGLNFEYQENIVLNENELFMENTKWVITGSFENFKPREKAGEIIKKYGGEIISMVSSKTTHLLCGESPGSKLEKAEKLNVSIIKEDDFLKMINNKKL